MLYALHAVCGKFCQCCLLRVQLNSVQGVGRQSIKPIVMHITPSVTSSANVIESSFQVQDDICKIRTVPVYQESESVGLSSSILLCLLALNTATPACVYVCTCTLSVFVSLYVFVSVFLSVCVSLSFFFVFVVVVVMCVCVCVCVHA